MDPPGFTISSDRSDRWGWAPKALRPPGAAELEILQLRGAAHASPVRTVDPSPWRG